MTIVDERKEKNTAQYESLRNSLTDSNRATDLILKNHASAPVKKKRVSPSNKAKRTAIENKFV